MTFQSSHALKALMLAAFAYFLVHLHANGDIVKFVNPKYNLLSLSAACLFFFLCAIQVFRIIGKSTHVCHHGCNHHSPRSKMIISYAILFFPLITGFLLPPQTLGAAIAAKKGTVLTSSSSSAAHEGLQATRKEMNQLEYDQALERLEKESVIHLKENVFEPYFTRISTEPQKYEGRKVRMSGFVYKEDGFADNQLALTRFLITHCVADAGSIGFLTELEDALSIEQDTWLEVEGTIELTHYDGAEMPMLKIVSWKEIDEPKEPYVYPVYIKIM